MPPGRHQSPADRDPTHCPPEKIGTAYSESPRKQGLHEGSEGPFAQVLMDPAAPDAPGVAGRMLLHGGAEGGMVAGMGQQSRAQSLLPVQKTREILHGDGPTARCSSRENRLSSNSSVFMPPPPLVFLLYHEISRHARKKQIFPDSVQFFKGHGRKNLVC